MDDLNMVIPEWNPFAMSENDAIAYWQACLEHAYRCLKGTAAAELQHRRPKEWGIDGLHQASAALGRAEAVEMMLPWLRDLWHVGEPEPTDFRPKISILREGAIEDADADLLAKTKLGLIATGELLAPEPEAEAA